MLIIDRNSGESIFLGENELKVLDIKTAERSVLISYAGKQYRIKTGTNVQLDQTLVHLHNVFNNKAKFGFDAPRSIRILRGELLDKEGSQPRNIDNSTKQFPSGEFK